MLPPALRQSDKPLRSVSEPGGATLSQKPQSAHSPSHVVDVRANQSDGKAGAAQPLEVALERRREFVRVVLLLEAEPGATLYCSAESVAALSGVA